MSAAIASPARRAKAVGIVNAFIVSDGYQLSRLYKLFKVSRLAFEERCAAYIYILIQVFTTIRTRRSDWAISCVS